MGGKAFQGMVYEGSSLIQRRSDTLEASRDGGVYLEMCCWVGGALERSPAPCTFPSQLLEMSGSPHHTLLSHLWLATGIEAVEPWTEAVTQSQSDLQVANVSYLVTAVENGLVQATLDTACGTLCLRSWSCSMQEVISLFLTHGRVGPA